MRHLSLLCLVLGSLNAAEISVSPNVLVSTAHSGDTHYEVLAAADPTTTGKMVVGAIFYPEGGAEARSVAYATTDGGNTWQPTLEGMGLLRTGDPAPAFGPDGTAYFTVSQIREQNVRRMLLYRSPDGGTTWEPRTELTYSDRQYITIDATGGKYNGRIYVNGNGRYPPHADDFVLFTSLDRGRTFNEGVGRAGDFRAPHMGNAVVASNGTLIGLFSQETSDGVILAVTFSEDGGATLLPAVTIDQFTPPGNRKAGNNNVAAQPILAIDGSQSALRDRLYAVWPDRRSGQSQILFSSSSDLGRTWTKARVVNDNPPDDRTDQFMPTVAVNCNGVVGILWYDRRDSSDNLGWDARFTASVDGGVTFLPSVRVSEAGTRFDSSTRWSSLRPAVQRAAPSRRDPSTKELLSVDLSLNSFLFLGGDTAGLVADAAGVFHPFWIDNHLGTPQVWTAAVKVAGPGALDPAIQPRRAEEALLTKWMTVELTYPHFDQVTQTLTATARLFNTSAEMMRGPFAMKVASIRSELGELQAANADNAQSGAGAEWQFADVQLNPGVGSEARVIRFKLTNRQPYRQGNRYRLGLLNLELTIHGSPP